MVVAPIIAPTDRLLPQPNPPSSEERGEERGKERGKERDLVLSFGRGEMEWGVPGNGPPVGMVSERRHTVGRRRP
jgi:hypothetical protein